MLKLLKTVSLPINWFVWSVSLCSMDIFSTYELSVTETVFELYLNFVSCTLLGYRDCTTEVSLRLEVNLVSL